MMESARKRAARSAVARIPWLLLALWVGVGFAQLFAFPFGVPW